MRSESLVNGPKGRTGQPGRHQPETAYLSGCTGFRIRAVSDLLEPCEAKVSSPVLRGGGGGDTLALPGGGGDTLALPGDAQVGRLSRAVGTGQETRPTVHPT